MFKAARIVMSTILCSSLMGSASGDFSSFHIGNSLTWDSQPNAIAAMSASQGRVHDVGYHIRCGSSLLEIAGDDTTCKDPVAGFGVWRDALANRSLDAITMQPYRSFSGDVSLRDDQDVILEMIDTAVGGANSFGDTRFLIYQAWPQTSSTTPGSVPQDYTAMWTTATVDDDDTQMTYTRDYFDHLIARVRSDRPLATVDMVPVGEVLAEIDERLATGELSIPGYSNTNDFYRDFRHLHMNALGRFVAANTTYAVLFGEDPTGIVEPEPFFNTADTAGVDYDAELLTLETQAELQSLIWDVVSDHPHTSVPEPGTAVITIVGVGLLMHRRRR